MSRYQTPSYDIGLYNASWNGWWVMTARSRQRHFEVSKGYQLLTLLVLHQWHNLVVSVTEKWLTCSCHVLHSGYCALLRVGWISIHVDYFFGGWLWAIFYYKNLPEKRCLIYESVKFFDNCFWKLDLEEMFELFLKSIYCILRVKNKY